MSLEYIRNTYKVPAYRGVRVRYTDEKGRSYEGVITSSNGQYLRIRRDGESRTYPAYFHPTWNIEYVDWMDTR